METITAKKGDRCRVTVLTLKKPGTFSLAGAQLKFSATSREFQGTITHIRGDHPTAPTKIGIWVKPDDGPEEGPFHPEQIVLIFEDGR